MNEEYVAGSCWRRYKPATSGQCPIGFTLRLGSICSANCPLERPVKCGPVCLPQGRSCAHEGLKKATVAGLLISKVTGVGFVGDECAKTLLLQQTARRDVVRRNLRPEGAACTDLEKSFDQLNADQFAVVVNNVSGEVGLNLIMKLDPYGVVAFAHEFVQDLCPIDTMTSETFAALNMDGSREHLGLQGKGVFPTNAGTWDPADKTNKVRVQTKNNLEFAVSLRVYSGGRRFRDKPATGTSKKGEKRFSPSLLVRLGFWMYPWRKPRGRPCTSTH